MNALRKYPTLLLLQIGFAVATVVVAVVVVLEIKPLLEKKSQLERKINLQESKADSLSVLRDTVLLLQKHQENVRLASEYIGKGILYAQHGKRQQAMKLYTQAIELDSTNPNAYQLRGYLLLKMKEFSSSVKDLEHSVVLDTNYTWGRYNLALAYWGSGFYENAVSEVKKVVRIDSGFKYIIREDKQFSPFRASAEFRKLIEWTAE